MHDVQISRAPRSHAVTVTVTDIRIFLKFLKLNMQNYFLTVSLNVVKINNN